MKMVQGALSYLLILLTVCLAQNNKSLHSSAAINHHCPKEFIRLNRRCYFFSQNKATWQQAHFQCLSMRSNLAIVKNAHQDKLLRKALTRKFEPLERWIGGQFDWQKKRWKWAASGKPVLYKSFDNSLAQQVDNLQWSCIILDPRLEYRWNARSCLESKHFICHKQMKNKPLKKHLKRRNNQINEILDLKSSPSSLMMKNFTRNNLKSVQAAHGKLTDIFTIEVNPNLNNNHVHVMTDQMENVKSKRNYPSQNIHMNKYMADKSLRRRRNKNKDEEFVKQNRKIYYKSYKEGSQSNDPRHPNTIVEEYNFAKE